MSPVAVACIWQPACPRPEPVEGPATCDKPWFDKLTTRLERSLAVPTNDLVKETRADLSVNRRPALYWLSAAITAARAYGLDVLDGVYNNFKDADGFRRECVHGRASASTARR